jgi:superfamily II DNA or RNA helicase
VDAIARGEKRILLVMATGTGKTYTAFQIIWRLWKSGAKKRILFLVDRNILADQTKTNDFKPFGQAMTKITNRTVDITSVESLEILKVDPLSKFGTPIEIVTLFGGKPAYLAAIRELETALYQKAA